MTINHVEIVDPDIHEPKGVSTATTGAAMFAESGASAFRPILLDDIEDLGLNEANAGEIIYADGLGSGSWSAPTPPAGSVLQGVYNYDDLVTATTPIALTLVDTDYILTNDAAGPQTLSYPIAGLTDMWDEVTNSFIWTSGSILALGDSVDIRFDIILTTTTVNTEVTIELKLDVGGLDISIPLIPSSNFASSGTYPLTRFTGIFMGSAEVLNGLANVVARSNKVGATIEVNGWYLRPLHTVL